MHVAPIIIIVACFLDQQLPILGQLASSQTVTIFKSSNKPLVSSKILPIGAFTFNQDGFGGEKLSGLFIFSGCLIVLISVKLSNIFLYNS